MAQGNLELLDKASVPQEGNDPRTMTLVKEQLAALQTGQLLFQGELFPGQQMEWRIKDREGRGRQQEQQNPWETDVTLNLPNLGKVKASLKLNGVRLDLELHVNREQTANLMGQEQGELHDQLLAAGLEPGSITVQHDT